jgi:hypothetical protein
VFKELVVKRTHGCLPTCQCQRWCSFECSPWFLPVAVQDKAGMVGSVMGPQVEEPGMVSGQPHQSLTSGEVQPGPGTVPGVVKVGQMGSLAGQEDEDNQAVEGMVEEPERPTLQ